MLIKMFTVYDSKAEAYMQPFFMQSVGAALRAFSDTVNDPSHAFSKHPEDYILFELGTYDDATASIQQNAPRSLGVAIEFVNKTALGFHRAITPVEAPAEQDAEV